MMNALDNNDNPDDQNALGGTVISESSSDDETFSDPHDGELCKTCGSDGPVAAVYPDSEGGGYQCWDCWKSRNQ